MNTLEELIARADIILVGDCYTEADKDSFIVDVRDKLTCYREEGKPFTIEQQLKYFLTKLTGALRTSEALAANNVGKWIDNECPHSVLDYAVEQFNEKYKPLPIIETKNVEGVLTWMKALHERELLWHMDDDAFDCLRETELSDRDISICAAMQAYAWGICQDAGADIHGLAYAVGYGGQTDDQESAPVITDEMVNAGAAALAEITRKRVEKITTSNDLKKEPAGFGWTEKARACLEAALGGE